MNVTVKDMPSHMRPREKLLELGPQALTDAELLAILLRTGYKGKNIIDLSTEITQQFGIKKLFETSFKDLANYKGVGKTKASTLLAISEIIKRVNEFQSHGDTINSTNDAVRYLTDIRNKHKEYLVGLYLNARHQLIKRKLISIGTLDSGLVHPREVFAPAIKLKAVSVIVAHNHPSGDTTPSQDDIRTTTRLQNAGRILGIELVDHIIVTSNNHQSILKQQTP